MKRNGRKQKLQLTNIQIYARVLPKLHTEQWWKLQMWSKFYH